MSLETGIGQVLAQLRDCLCFALSTTEAGAPCSCCVIHAPPSVVFAEYSRCGVGWVRLVELAPRPDVRRRTKTLADGSKCGSRTPTQTTVELGVLRCVPSSDTGDLCACVEGHASDAMDDLQAILTAIDCCGFTYELVRATPTSVQYAKDESGLDLGLAAGTEVTITVSGLVICTDCGSPDDESP